MRVSEARRTRHLVLRLEAGDDLPAALVRALDEHQVKSASIRGAGTVEDAELLVLTPDRRSVTRKLDGAATLVSLVGHLETSGGARSPRLHATLARETDRGNDVVAGELVAARALSLFLDVTALDDGPAIEAVAPPPVAEPRAVSAPSTFSSGASMPEPGPLHSPPRPLATSDDLEIYPEAGELVSHFLFGECVVISSDGDRIRLRQDKDGRVREVALTMLKIDPPTVDPEGGKRHFNLRRKN